MVDVFDGDILRGFFRREIFDYWTYSQVRPLDGWTKRRYIRGGRLIVGHGFWINSEVVTERTGMPSAVTVQKAFSLILTMVNAVFWETAPITEKIRVA